MCGRWAPRFVPDGKPHGAVRLGIRIARNLAVSEWRRLRPTEEIGALETDETALAEMPAPPDPLLRRTIAECREKLPGKPRQALDARLEGDGTTPDETLAARLSMQKKHISPKLHPARASSSSECLRAPTGSTSTRSSHDRAAFHTSAAVHPRTSRSSRPLRRRTVRGILAGASAPSRRGTTLTRQDVNGPSSWPRALRTLEAAADPRGLSTTGRAVLARVRAGGG